MASRTVERERAWRFEHWILTPFSAEKRVVACDLAAIVPVEGERSA